MSATTRAAVPADRTHLTRNLRMVQTGRKSRAAGISRCADCHAAFIADDSGLRLCGDCRLNHTRQCGQCRTPFPNTPAGDRLCQSCQNQPALFDPTGGDEA